MAFETDMLDYDRDIFEGSVVIEEKVAALMAGARPSCSASTPSAVRRRGSR